MPTGNFVKDLETELTRIERAGQEKGNEAVVVGVRPADGSKGPRFRLRDGGETEFIRMNSNSYLGLSLTEELLEAEETAARRFGVGPGAVRFISGTYAPHLELEAALARFHGREACMITSAAYTSVLGVLVSLTTPETVILSDALNHNCIINAMKLARPKGKRVFGHLDLATLEQQITELEGEAESLLVVTDGVFSMRGDFAPLKEMSELVARHNHRFPRDIVLVVDDSHGVGAYGATGRGTEELTDAGGVDILIGTLGKAFGVNGGYTVAAASIIRYLREKNPFYIYTNPITPSEAAAALAAVNLLQGEKGTALLQHLQSMTRRFETGLQTLGYETIPSPHPVVPLLVRDTQKTNAMVRGLRERGVLATGLSYPVVPKGDELIRFQVCADHTLEDIDHVLEALRELRTD